MAGGSKAHAQFEFHAYSFLPINARFGMLRLQLDLRVGLNFTREIEMAFVGILVVTVLLFLLVGVTAYVVFG